MRPRSLPIHQLHNFPRLCSPDHLIFPSFLPPSLARCFDSLSPAPAFSNPSTITDDNPHCEIQRTAARNGIRSGSSFLGVGTAKDEATRQCTSSSPSHQVRQLFRLARATVLCSRLTAGTALPHENWDSEHLLGEETFLLVALAFVAIPTSYSFRTPTASFSPQSRFERQPPAARLLHTAFVRVAACLVLVTHSRFHAQVPREEDRMEEEQDDTPRAMVEGGGE
ncbi:hypothetical protein B0H13DRAFT_2429790 [Mycena leptocephala]|nr:hypothetical protein B0H13DRAFT_2429790 [Mycena leptocephala]